MATAQWLHEVSIDLIRATCLGGVLLAALLLEHRWPLAPMVRPWITNLGLWLVDTALLRVVCGACGLVLAAWCQANHVGAFQLLRLPDWLAVVFSVVALDAVSYFWHRANHRFPWLWRWHRVHHADRAFQVTTALRFHPGELLLSLPVRLLAIAILGLPMMGVLLFEIVFGAMNLLVHTNVALPHRLHALSSWLVVTPRLHRLHHARSLAFSNRNFGTVFSLFDRAFGTLADHPASHQFETGIEGPEGNAQMSLRESLVAPLSN